MQKTYRLFSVVGLGVAFSAGLVGQSMIEYGQGVGRAAAAGAASGTGIAGIFSKVRDTSDDDKTKKRTTSRAQSSDAHRTSEYERDPGEPGNAPLKMKTSSGVVVSGVSPSWMSAAYSDPQGKPVHVQKVEWSNPADDEAAEQEAGIAGEGEETAQVPPAAAAENGATDTAVADTHGPAHVVAPEHTFGDASAEDSASSEQAFNAPAQLEAVTTAEVAGVRIGSRIEEVIQTLGRPTFSFTGLTGRSYTEKYVFKKADGETITVLTWAGVVTSVLVS